MVIILLSIYLKQKLGDLNFTSNTLPDGTSLFYLPNGDRVSHDTRIKDFSVARTLQNEEYDTIQFEDTEIQLINSDNKILELFTISPINKYAHVRMFYVNPTDASDYTEKTRHITLTKGIISQVDYSYDDITITIQDERKFEDKTILKKFKNPKTKKITDIDMPLAFGHNIVKGIAVPETKRDIPAWESVTSDTMWFARTGHTSVVSRDRIWLLGGWADSRKNDVWSSADGKTWVEETKSAGWSARSELTSVVFRDRIWVMGGQDGDGYKNDVWSSIEGDAWVQETSNAGWSARTAHTSVVFNNRIWVMGGVNATSDKNDVWSSVDGKVWKQETPHASWSARRAHTSVVFNNRIWVMGGYDGGDKNDVWSSVDGKTWVEETKSAGWSARAGHTSVVFKDKIWILGGNRKNDVWSSVDGKTWKQDPAFAGWSARRAHISVVFKDSIWVMGGYDGKDKNDIWRSTISHSRIFVYADPSGVHTVKNVFYYDTNGKKQLVPDEMWKHQDGNYHPHNSGYIIINPVQEKLKHVRIQTPRFLFNFHKSDKDNVKNITSMDIQVISTEKGNSVRRDYTVIDKEFFKNVENWFWYAFKFDKNTSSVLIIEPYPVDKNTGDAFYDFIVRWTFYKGHFDLNDFEGSLNRRQRVDSKEVPQRIFSKHKFGLIKNVSWDVAEVAYQGLYGLDTYYQLKPSHYIDDKNVIKDIAPYGIVDTTQYFDINKIDSDVDSKTGEWEGHLLSYATDLRIIYKVPEEIYIEFETTIKSQLATNGKIAKELLNKFSNIDVPDTILNEMKETLVSFYVTEGTLQEILNKLTKESFFYIIMKNDGILTMRNYDFINDTGSIDPDIKLSIKQVNTQFATKVNLRYLRLESNDSYTLYVENSAYAENARKNFLLDNTIKKESIITESNDAVKLCDYLANKFSNKQRIVDATTTNDIQHINLYDTVSVPLRVNEFDFGETIKGKVISIDYIKNKITIKEI